MNLIPRILRRRSHYRAVFRPGTSTDAVLADLKRFSGTMSTTICISHQTGQVDPIATAVRIGRQEMFLRIVGHLAIDDAQLLNLKETAHDD